MKRTFAMLALALVTMIGSPAQANVTYTLLGGSVGTGSFNGSITTDGTIGFLTATNIVDWNISLDGNPGNTFTLLGPSSGNNSAYQSATDNILFTTSTGLFADFANTGYALFQNPNIGSGGNYLCFAGSGQTCGNFSGPAITLGTSQWGLLERAESATRVQISGGSAIPEPATVALLGIGLVGVLMMRRSRRI